MVGLFHFTLLFSLTLLTGCAQLAEIDVDPHFWPGARHRMRRVPASVGLEAPIVAPLMLKNTPSIQLSEWHLLSKGSDAQRDYNLIVRDEKNKLMDTPQAPEMILDGDVVLHGVQKIGEASWKVRVEFTRDQSIVKVGFALGGHRVAGFRQMQFNLHELDVFASQSYVLKTHVRADGKDNLRVYVSFKDVKGYSIYSSEDFSLKMNVNSKAVKVEGPFSTSSGPYFRLTSLKSHKVDYHVIVDGERVSGGGQVVFTDASKRGPAAEVGDCLADMAVIGHVKVPDHLGPTEAYKELAQAIMRRYEEKRDVTPDSLTRGLAAFSTEACTANSIWDVARDDAGRVLRVLHQRLSR